MKRVLNRLSWLLFVTMFMVQTAGVAFALRRKREVIEAPDPTSDDVTLSSIFGPLDFTSTAQAFRGGSLSCLYGGGIVDLRRATLAPGGANLRVQAFNGGAQILVPASWRLEVKVTGLGGVRDARPQIDRPSDAPVLRIEGWAMFGGFGIASEGTHGPRPAERGFGDAAGSAADPHHERLARVRKHTMETREVRNAIPPKLPLRVLIFGAGVLGSLYGARLAEAGNDVTVLARGRRLGELRARGVVLEDVRSGARSVTPVRIVSELAPDDPYDVVVVLVRKTQLASVLPPLAASRATPNVLVMVSNPSGLGELIAALGRERLLLGFAGAGGTLDQGVVRYAMAPRLFQPTTIGELDGSKSPRLRRIAAAFREAGLPTRLESHIDAWLKTHEAWVSPFANAIYAAAGSNYTLARSPDALRLLVRAIREGFLVLDQLDVPVTPARFRVLRAVPERLLVTILQGVVGTPAIEVLAARHANAARDEMSTLAAEFAALAERAGVPTPAMNALRQYCDPSVRPLTRVA